MAQQDGAYILDTEASIPLNKLRANNAQHVDCPFCHKKTQTRLEKEGTQHATLLNICCWPLSNRKHFLEWNHWFCKDCGKELAKQKWGKEIIVLAPTKA